MSAVMAISRPAPDALPGVGEHTVEILAELGVTAAETDALPAA